MQYNHSTVGNKQDLLLLVFLCQRQTSVEKVLTQWSSQQSVDNDVSVAPDGWCEVSVEGNVEGIVLK